MKKIDYIRLSHSEANRKIWDSIIKKYVALKQRSKLSGFVWIIAASITFGFISVFSWFSFLGMFFKNIRFTQHYMRTVITVQSMTTEQANNYLDSCFLDYKNCLSYGNIPLKEQKRIEATFELLHREFGTPKPDNLQVLTQIAAKGNSELKTISSYIVWKYTEEKAEIERKQQLQYEQAKRKISTHNRMKGRMLDSFEPALTEEQLDMLVNCCNDIQVFTRDIEAYEIEEILLCSHSEPLQVTVNKHLALLFDKLHERRLICKTWMSVAERYNCFISRQGKPITSKDLSAALSTASLIKQEIEDQIYVKQVETKKHGRMAKSLFKYGLGIIANSLLNLKCTHEIDVFKFLSCTY
jgi:hypothetical protein